VTARSLTDLKREERENRRRLILETALALFASKDFREVTSREIARKAGMSVGTLFNYYKTMDALFLDIFLKNTEALTQMIQSSGRDPADLPAVCDIYITFLNDHMVFYQMMGHFMLGAGLSVQSTEKLNHYMRRLLDPLEAALRSAGIAPDSRTLSHALFSALNGIMISYARYPGRSADEIRSYTRRLAEVVAHAFLRLAPGS
jgi:AcrR family transcriptional regulator